MAVNDPFMRVRHLVLSLLAMSTLTACGGGDGNTYSVGGTVSGLAGSGLVLRNNGGDDLAVSAAGSFTFSSQVASDAAYHVTVYAQPTNPVQNCAVTNGTGEGKVTVSNVTVVAIACATIGRFAYVANYTDQTISAYTIDPITGALTPGAGSPFPTKLAVSLAADPAGLFLYAANYAWVFTANWAPGVSAYAIDADTGALSEVYSSSFATDEYPRSIAVDPAGKFAYVTTERFLPPGDGMDSFNSYTNIWAYKIDPATGALTAVTGGPYATGNGSGTVTVNPNGKFVYVVTHVNAISDIWAYNVDPVTGVLTAVAGSPFGAGDITTSLTVEARGKFAYAFDLLSNDILIYAIDATSGALTAIAGSPYQVGCCPDSMTSDPSGTYLFVTNSYVGVHNVAAYLIDASTGALTEVGGSPFTAGAYPFSPATDPSGKFLYLLHASDKTTSAYAIDGNAGTLSPVTGSPWPTGDYPVAIAISR